MAVMYNLMVTAGDNLWEEGVYTWPVSRMFEYTEDDIKTRFADFSTATLAELTKIPTLFIYEDGAEGTPRVGRIIQITKRGGEVRIRFEFDEHFHPLTSSQIQSLKWELQIQDFEFARTHWAVKSADIFRIIAPNERIDAATVTDALDKFKDDATLEEIIAAIHRDLRANKYATCLDRLHAYCMKKFSHLLKKHGISCEREEPLHSRVGKYVKAVEQKHALHEFSKRAIKSSIGIFEQFNHVRNNATLSHDNELLDKAEARFIFDAVISILRFVNTLEESFSTQKPTIETTARGT